MRKGKKMQEKNEKPARQRLLDAAMDVFGKHGYDGATTRMIAREACVNIASIPYYFEGKEGLYTALVKEIAALISSQVQEVQDEIDRTDFSRKDGPEKARQFLEQMLNRILTFMIGSSQAPRVARIILREHLFPSAAYDFIFTGFMGAILNSMTDLIRVIAPQLSEEEAQLRSIAITGQIIVFRIAREAVVRALSFEGYNAEELQKIRTVILAHTKSALDELQAAKG